MDIDILVIGKRAGLTFAEINEFRARDLLAYINAYTGTEDKQSQQATQADIDAFFA